MFLMAKPWCSRREILASNFSTITTIMMAKGIVLARLFQGDLETIGQVLNERHIPIGCQEGTR